MVNEHALEISVVNKENKKAMSEIYARIVSDGAVHRVFWDGSVNSEEDFVYAMSANDNVCYLISENGEGVAVAWINGFTGMSAQLHYCVFRNGYGKPYIGAEFVRYVMSLKDSDGTYCLNALIGVTPIKNKLAVRYMKHVGFGIITDVFMVKHGVTGELHPVVVSIYTRSEVCDG